MKCRGRHYVLVAPGRTAQSTARFAGTRFIISFRRIRYDWLRISQRGSRDYYMWHAKPFVQQKMANVVRVGDSNSNSKLKLSDRYGKRVIAVNGYTYADDFYIAKPQLQFENALSHANALQVLNGKFADYAILEERILVLNLKTDKILKPLAGKVRVAGYLDPLDGYVSFNKKHPGIDQIIKAFDDAQARLERSGAIASILKRHEY